MFWVSWCSKEENGVCVKTDDWNWSTLHLWPLENKITSCVSVNGDYIEGNKYLNYYTYK